VACGTALLPQSLLAAAPAGRPLRGGLPLRAGDNQALDFVRRYSSQLRVVGASVLGRIRTTGLRALHILAEVTDLDALQAALVSGAVGDLYADGNVISFTCGDVDATVENLLPDIFAARLASMGKRAGNAFAHDALSYDPATNLLSDPFAARSGEVKVINRSFGGNAALEVSLRGTFEASQLNLPLGGNFGPWRARFLRQIARSADAPQLATTFLSSLAALAEKIPFSAFQALLRTRLISTALKQAFGIDTAAVIATFIEERSTTDSNISDSALWLSILLGSEINEPSVSAASWTQWGNHFQLLRSRQALQQAATITNN
jgi:hypothetical protein